MRARTFLFTAAALAFFCSSAQAQSGRDKIDALDAQFRQMYATSRQTLLDQSGPIILATGPSIELFQNGKVTRSVTYQPLIFDVLKTSDHIVLAIFADIVANPSQLNAMQKDQLKTLRDRVVDAEPQILACSMSDETRDKQKRMIATSLAFIDKVLAAGSSNPAELKAFLMECLPTVDSNIKEATYAELDALHNAVTSLRSALTSEEWQKTHVVLSTVHMARDQQMLMQYFSRLLDEPKEGGRIIVIEGQDDQKTAMNLLGTHILDKQIGLFFFGDAWRMHRDLLSSATNEWLDNHPLK